MERKIGEIFEYKGEWYQCVGGTCRNCSFYYDTACKNITTIGSTNFGNCHWSLRTDHKSVIFKKLEKVGEPFTSVGKLYQHYKVFEIDNVCGDGFWCVHNYKAKTLTIEIKQTKEDMEEYRMHDAKEDIPEFDKVVDECLFGEDKLNLKPFDLEAAKAGKPVCTRDGRKARIICFDRKGYDMFPIVALIMNGDRESDIYTYRPNGTWDNSGNESDKDLMMLPEKKEGWVNVYREESNNNERLIEQIIYKTRKDAFDNACPQGYITTTKINWEE
ncbi:hypothetical protein M3090_01495 [Bacteroides sp. ET71]|uniref:hypothetical protein n=1 Tax=Bacteroides sp. ET71 TaxID=2939421 RepID=UPI00201112F2|nr:hypothetical protein [Bacteroides sp. ET71]MCL1615085.1 hypothetical protein [Bacteroides sp. ET71]